MKLGVRVVYCNSKIQPVCEKHYDLQTYLDLLRNDLLRLITDVEDTIYQSNGNASKDEWSDKVWTGFTKIKHKLLDKAGDISRLADNIYEIKEEEYGTYRLGSAREHPERDTHNSSCGGTEP